MGNNPNGVRTVDYKLNSRNDAPNTHGEQDALSRAREAVALAGRIATGMTSDVEKLSWEAAIPSDEAHARLNGELTIN